MDEGFTPGGKQADPKDTPDGDGKKTGKLRQNRNKAHCGQARLQGADHSQNRQYMMQTASCCAESIVDYTKENIRGEYASLDNFIRQWSAQEKKEQIRDLLHDRGIDLELLKADQKMTDSG